MCFPKYSLYFARYDYLNTKAHFVQGRIYKFSDFRTVIFGVKCSLAFDNRRNVCEISISQNFQPNVGQFTAYCIGIICAQKANRKRSGAPLRANNDLFAFSIKCRIASLIDVIPSRFVFRLFHQSAAYSTKLAGDNPDSGIVAYTPTGNGLVCGSCSGFKVSRSKRPCSSDIKPVYQYPSTKRNRNGIVQ
jgi:hypothetical protein